MLCDRQLGFARDISTVTNVTCNKIIADAILVDHHYEINYFELKTAFNKVPHFFVIEALFAKGIKWTLLC